MSNSHSPYPTARVAVPGTCGELVQGTWDGTPCLVSCPIDHYSVANVQLTSHAEWELQPERPKIRTALQQGLAVLDHSTSGGTVRVCSTLPQGRGYGSSTADIGAVLYALSTALGQPFTPLDVAALALQVEPTDSSLFPELTLWDHRHGQCYETLGTPPTLTVMVLDPGGEINTVAYNQSNHHRTLQHLTAQHRDAFQLLRDGIQRSDRAAIGAAATLSAETHQAILPNTLLEPAIQLAREVGALGVCRAHSGTVIGLLLDPDPSETDRVQRWVQHRLTGHIQISTHRLIAGGPRLLTAVNSNIETKPLSATAQLR